MARRLAENADVSVLLLEAGGSDDDASVKDASAWPSLRGGEHDWAFRAKPNPRLKGRAIPMAMGKVLGGGSSINVMVWSRGYKKDWDHFAAEAGDEGWNYQSVLEIFRRIEDWHGALDPTRRGKGGLLFVQPAPEPNPLAAAMLDAFAAGAELEAFIGNATVSHSHQTCTAKMGRDAMSVVDHRLRVYGIKKLRIADGSIMPRIVTGNTMAPCVVIGERAGEILKADHNV